MQLLTVNEDEFDNALSDMWASIAGEFAREAEKHSDAGATDLAMMCYTQSDAFWRDAVAAHNGNLDTPFF